MTGPANEGPILITGGCGFIGCNLADALARRGDRVIAFDNLSRSGVRENAHWLKSRYGASVNIVTGDIRDSISVIELVRNVRAVLHLAAQVAVTESLLNPVDDFEINARGTLNVLEAIRLHNPSAPLVFASTNKVYGRLFTDAQTRDAGRRYEPADRALAGGIDETAPLDFYSPYGCAKGAVDQYVRDYARVFGLKTAVLRMSCIYGPRQFGTEDQGWLAHFLLRVLVDQPIMIYGDGKQVRDALHISDAVRAWLAVMDNIDTLRGRIFNLGGGPDNTTSLLELLDSIALMRGALPSCRFEAWRPGDQPWYVSRIDALRDAIGWRPTTPLDQGLLTLNDWLESRFGRMPRRTAGICAMIRVALINPNWQFDGSIYFGCREPHLPLELGISQQLLEQNGHRTLLLDAHMFSLSMSDIADELDAFKPDMVVVTTAPTYLFWRCAPPELRVPQKLIAALRDRAPIWIAVGPHGSTTPRAALSKLDVDFVVMGECEHVVARLARGERDVAGTCFRDPSGVLVLGGPQIAPFSNQPALRWPDEMVRRHHHHHHRFEARPVGPGAEVEASRGCPYSCTFCAKENFRNGYRKRDAAIVLAEIDDLKRQGVEYVYFIDEIFLPDAALLEAMVARKLLFGVQTRIDLWKPEMLELLGRAGCVSIEAGIESLTPEGRDLLGKRCRMTTEQLAQRLVTARKHVPFVQANLIEVAQDDETVVQRWRDSMRDAGVWANDPVPLYPYPGSPDYRKFWGEPDDRAWERAHDHYLGLFAQFSDIQEQRPIRLRELERGSRP